MDPASDTPLSTQETMEKKVSLIEESFGEQLRKVEEECARWREEAARKATAARIVLVEVGADGVTRYRNRANGQDDQQCDTLEALLAWAVSTTGAGR